MKNTFREKTEDTDLKDMAGAYQSFEYTHHLLDAKSEFQKIDVYQTKSFGRVLALDGVVQLTEKDAFIYHEMLVHVPMMSRSPARDVLVVGGGDGFSVREILKHDSVEDITMIEIDEDVIRAARSYFGMQEVLNHHKLEIIDDDAADVLRNGIARHFDVAIVDSTDPGSSGGQAIYNSHFMASLAKHIRPGGVVSVMQGLPMVQGLAHVREMDKIMSFLGFTPYLYTTTVPTYYGGVTAMSLYVKGCRRHGPDAYIGELPERKHHSNEVHEAAFAIPGWIKEIRDGS